MVTGRVRVLLVFGGRSAEHEVSCTSAASAARALDPSRYEVIPVGITTEGRWLLAVDALAALRGPRDALPGAFRADGPPVALIPEPGRRELAALDGATRRDQRTDHASLAFDVVLPLLHGPFGEDGTVQGLFELADVPYVGSGVVGSAVAMDKVMAKRAFLAAGLPTPAHVAFRDGDDVQALVARVESGLGYPCFVKPANLGSSVGVAKAPDRKGLEGALADALAFDEWVLVEEAIAGREIEVAILGDPPEASVPGEIVPGDEFYTYADKYEHGDAELLAPAPLEPTQVDEARALAVRAFEACRCEAMGRVDLFLEEHGAGGQPARGFLVNEVNAIPGFTAISMYPRLWGCSGVSYDELLDRLVQLALARHERRRHRAGRQRSG